MISSFDIWTHFWCVRLSSKILRTKPWKHTHRIHVWIIYLHFPLFMWPCFTFEVGKSSIHGSYGILGTVFVSTSDFVTSAHDLHIFRPTSTSTRWCCSYTTCLCRKNTEFHTKCLKFRGTVTPWFLPEIPGFSQNLAILKVKKSDGSLFCWKKNNRTFNL